MEKFITEEIKKYNVTDAEIAKLKDKYLSVEVKDPKDVNNYLVCKEGHQITKALRLEIEKKRKELKQSSLEYGRAVDAEAKRITSGILEVEEHLYAQRKVVEDEKKRLQEEAERKQREEEDRIKREEQERMEAVRREQEEKERQLKAEREKIEAEKAAIRAEKDKIEREKREAIEAQECAKREELERIEREKRHALEIKEAEERAKRDAIAAHERELREKEAAEKQAQEEAARLKALAPDIEKMKSLKDELSLFDFPSVNSEDAQAVLFEVERLLRQASEVIAQFLLETKKDKKDAKVQRKSHKNKS